MSLYVFLSIAARVLYYLICVLIGYKVRQVGTKKAFFMLFICWLIVSLAYCVSAKIIMPAIFL